MFIKTFGTDFMLCFEGYFDDGIFIPSEVAVARRVTIEDVQSIFDQFEALGNSDATHVDIAVGRFTYNIDREIGRQLLNLVSQVLFEEECAELDDILPEDEWTEQYLLSL